MTITLHLLFYSFQFVLIPYGGILCGFKIAALLFLTIEI